MERLTKKEAISRHRKMWRWIADKTKILERCVDKHDAFKELWPDLEGKIRLNCWCCEYDDSFNGFCCPTCPIEWPGRYCLSSLYQEWMDLVLDEDFLNASKVARKISDLPEREGDV